MVHSIYGKKKDGNAQASKERGKDNEEIKDLVKLVHHFRLTLKANRCGLVVVS